MIARRRPMLVCVAIVLACLQGGISIMTSAEDMETTHMFHTGADALAWDSDVLTHVQSLHGVSFDNETEYLLAGDLASYLKLTPISGIHMPVPLNIIFVGFKNDGNMHVDIPLEEVQEWFGHLDHVMPHTRVEMAELTCSEDGHCAGLVHGRFRPTPMHSFVHLNFTCQVVLVKNSSVIETFERAIHAFSRPVDPRHESGTHQVDAAKMEAFVGSFVSYLGPQNAVSLVVINPAWSADEPRYGYRQGFSSAEMEHLSESRDLAKLVAAGSNKREPEAPMQEDINSGRNWLLEEARVTASKFNIISQEANSEAWLAAVAPYLEAEELLRRDLLELAGKKPGAAAVVQAARVLHMRRRTAVMDILEEELHSSLHPVDPNAVLERSVHSRFITMHPAEDCLVSNWVGHGRWLLVDLTAGGGDWGPFTGGQGVVNAHTLPAVHDYFGTLHSLKKSIRKDITAKDEHERIVARQLEMERAQRLGSASRHFARLRSMEMDAREMASKAPGAEPRTDKDIAEADQEFDRKYREFVAQNELSLYESFSKRFCMDADPRPAICGQMRQDYQRLRNSLSRMASSSGTSFQNFINNASWLIFGDDPKWEEEFEEVSEESSRARGLFMAELSSILSRAIRHVVAPPSAVWRHNNLQAHDVATRYAREVHFQIYLINDASHHTWTSLPHTSASGFDLQAFQEEVMRLKLDNQDFEFTHTQLSMSSEPGLAVAFAASLKTAAHAVPSIEDTMDEVEQVYLESEELAHYLRRQFSGHAKQREETRASRRRDKLQIPVYVFQVERATAILIDEHYNARALDDMVIVVHNNARHDEHPTGMMCGGAVVPRALNPLRAALAATLLHLGGVLPPHLGYSPAESKVTHDWLWSVGNHPLAFTASGSHFSQLQVDALHRAYVLDAVDTTVDLVNRGIHALRSRPTQPPRPQGLANSGIGGLLQAAREAAAARGDVVEGLSEEDAHGSGWARRKKKSVIPANQLRELMETYAAIVSRWRTIMTYSYELDWGAGTEDAVLLEEDAADFLRLARAAAGLHTPGEGAEGVQAHLLATPVTQCQDGSGGVVMDPSQRTLDRIMVASYLVAGLALLYAVWPVLRVFRTKVN